MFILTPLAPQSSSKCAILVVPGIATMYGLCDNAHTKLNCAGVTSLSFAHFLTKSSNGALCFIACGVKRGKTALLSGNANLEFSSKTPVRYPRPKGEYATKSMPSSSNVGKILVSGSLYQIAYSLSMADIGVMA
nr:hypothetical protein [Campylobacter hyointestinalis]